MAQSIGARRRWLIIAVAVVVALAIVLSGLSGFYVDILWFRELHFSGVFWKIFWSKLVLGLIFGSLFFALLLVNLVIVRRLTPRFRPFSPEQEAMERYRVAFEPYAGWIIPGFAALIALFVGVAASAQWQTFLLWRSVGQIRFGARFLDPVFQRDPSFYIFVLPFQRFVQGWLFSALVGVTVIAAIGHYLTGGIRLQTAGEKVTAQVKAHLSVLLGLIVAVKAWGYYLGKFGLVTSRRGGVVTGASYTDIHAELPALKLLVFIAIACAILFLVNIRFRGWALPVLGIGLLALTSIVAGAAVPAAVQRFRVAPDQLRKEQPYITRNIAATRYAFGLDKVRLSEQSTVSSDVTAQQVQQNDPTISNIRLWSPAILKADYQQLQRIQPYYEFSDVDVDRYLIDGQRRVVMLSPREVSQNGIPGGGGTWQNKYLVYTHGYGAVASPVNTVTSDGAPIFVLKDVPPVDQGIRLGLPLGAQIYYGERADVPYLVAGGSTQTELNFPQPSGGSDTTRYAGKGGIPIGGFFRRLVFAYRYKDFNLLISGLIDGNSRILINRDIMTRVRKAAPFLRYDGDPYAAIVGGRLKYIWDAYTTTADYPYSQRMNMDNVATNTIDSLGTGNYIRNSVKAVMDAYDGTVTFYVVDPSDPLIRVWEQAFPRLFTPVSEAPAELVAHFRYPENLMQIQATQFANYHVTDPRTFYLKQNFWALPNAPSTTPGSGITNTPMRPYYVLLKLPDQAQEQFVLFMPLTPFNRPNMVAYMAGLSDPGQYGRIEAFQFPGGQNVNGPQQVRAMIDQDPNVSQEITLLSQQGSKVVFGDLLVIPIDQGFIYAQPIFVVSAQQNAIPELKRVVIVHGSTVTLANSLTQAVTTSFGTQPTPTPGPTPTPTGQVGQLLQQAIQHFQKADQFLKQGDLAGYQREINAAEDLIRRAEQLQASGTSGGTGTPSPSPSPSPTP